MKRGANTPGGAGQIATWTQQADAQTPQVWVTEYDAVDQLLGVTVRSNSVAGAVLKQFLYRYDKAGNRTTEQIQSSCYGFYCRRKNGGSGGVRFLGN